MQMPSGGQLGEQAECKRMSGGNWSHKSTAPRLKVRLVRADAKVPARAGGWLCLPQPGCTVRQDLASDGVITGLPTWLRSREAACQCRRRGFVLLQEEVATHCGAPAWRVPWTEEPGGLQSVGLQRVGRDLAAGDTHRVIMGSQWVASKSQTD